MDGVAPSARELFMEAAREVAQPEVTVTVKHTFIELVATPCKPGARARAMTDPAPVVQYRLQHKGADAPLPDFSDASTDATLEPEDGFDWYSSAEVWPQEMSAWWASAGYEAASASQEVSACMPVAWQDCAWHWSPQDYYVAGGDEVQQAYEEVDSSHFHAPAAGHLPEELENVQDHTQGCQTTVMFRNLPNNYSRRELLDLLDLEGGFAGKYDFVYLPIDFKSQAGLGYAFVNFTSPSDAESCWPVFEGFTRWVVPSAKVCSVTWGNPLQGFTAHVNRYRDSPVMHASVPDDWKPVIFSGGERVTFPQPTKNIKPPKLRLRNDQ